VPASAKDPELHVPVHPVRFVTSIALFDGHDGAINDNCNSLHTNTYDEAVTIPSEESVRRALPSSSSSNASAGWR
jgi:hypothetical protein